jgi:hypothetical protein
LGCSRTFPEYAPGWANSPGFGPTCHAAPPPAAAPRRLHLPGRRPSSPSQAMAAARATSRPPTRRAQATPRDGHKSAARQIRRLGSRICPRPGRIRAAVAPERLPAMATKRRPAPAQGPPSAAMPRRRLPRQPPGFRRPAQLNSSATVDLGSCRSSVITSGLG